jgi:molecular chaperone GrpE
VFKVDLDGLDDFEALLQRTMGEAAGLTPVPKKAQATRPADKAAPPAKQVVASQWRKPDVAKAPERARVDGPSQESRAVDELRKKVKAMTSETESYRRRLEDSAKAARGKGREDVFKALMPIMDAIEMALKAAEGASAGGDQFTKGIELVHKQLKTDLGLLGLQLIAPFGDLFDPTVHEALQQVTTGKVAPGQVAEVIRNGYRFEERLLRPAQVLVEKA